MLRRTPRRQRGEAADRVGDHCERGDGGREGQAEECVEREGARTGEGERHRGRGIEEGDLDAVRRGKEAVAPVHRDGGDDHHREHQRRTDRAEQTESDEQAAGELAEARGEGEEASGTKAEAFEEAAGAVQAVAAEPAEELLGSVSGHDETEDQTGDEQSFVHTFLRSEERRVGKERRSRWSPYHY